MPQFYKMASGRMRMSRNGGSRQGFKSLSTRPRFRFAPRMGRRYWGPRPTIRRNFPRLELKFHDVDLDDSLIANTGGITASINLIPQGVTEVTRIGRKCTIKQINWRFNLALGTQTSGGNASDIARVIMYVDKQANKATAAITDILESADYQSFNNLANKNRFRTLMDRTYDINALAGGGDGTAEDYGQVLIQDTFFKKVNIPVEFSAGTGAIGEITSYNIGVLLISRAGLATFNSKIRLRFSDL